ncbi:hypothetical protein YB2330_006560 [Saitoella coloradoensis]
MAVEAGNSAQAGSVGMSEELSEDDAQTVSGAPVIHSIAATSREMPALAAARRSNSE